MSTINFPLMDSVDALRFRKISTSNWEHASIMSTVPLASNDYFEVKVESSDANRYIMIGVCHSNCDLNTYVGNDANSWSFHVANGSKYHACRYVDFTTPGSVGDIYGFRLDLENHGTVTLYRNGIKLGILVSGLKGPLYACLSLHTIGDTVTVFPDANAPTA